MRLAPDYINKSADEIAAYCRDECGAKCCKGLAWVRLKESEVPRLKEIAEGRGLPLLIEQDTTFGPVIIHKHQEQNQCPFLGDDSRCSIYDDRPMACVLFPDGANQCAISEKQSKVFVATIHGRNVDWDFLNQRDRVIDHLRSANMFGGRCEASGCRVDANRNRCVENFLKSDCTHLLFLDDDMTFHPETGVRLAKYDADVVSGLYFQRQDKETYPHLYSYLHYGPGEYGQLGHMFLPMTDEIYRRLKDFPPVDKAVAIDGTPLLDVGAGGTGCTMIARRVLEKMPAPWFRTEGSTNGDMLFFHKVNELGFQCKGDWGLICGHKKHVYIGLKTFIEAMDGPGVWNTGAEPEVNSKEYWEQVYVTEKALLRHYEGMREVIQNIVSGFDDDTLVFGDFGCGQVTIHHDLDALGKVKIVGIDQSETAVESCKQKFPQHEWIVGDVTKKVLEPNSIDIAFSNSVLEHLHQPEKLLDEMWKTVRPGGVMVVAVPLDMPHKEHTMVYDWNLMMDIMRKYAFPLISYPLTGRVIVLAQKVGA